MFQSLSGKELAGLAAVTAVHYEDFWVLPSYSVPGVFAWPLGELQFLHGLHFQLVEPTRSLLVPGPGTTFGTMQTLRSGVFWGCRASKRPVYGPTPSLTHTQEAHS